ncbi:MAG: hypothetical protein A2586_02690 [Candidatus Harrisonbacteria bacterium RIFOXYD1_FULL_40_9]|uniref:Uncharacterized protein n=1 Tax=Candidatus Harrisonbacteria bacterium RIFOXYD1_FULL_40_9 TaxID=1798412 RepID=A0A1G1ZYQ3_9BACT|nr:MAG: hypothetical protein A2586_02690 [Candidatus Harrisonbacteria bacterium RIFOXYD1_FULL_40_9]
MEYGDGRFHIRYSKFYIPRLLLTFLHFRVLLRKFIFRAEKRWEDESGGAPKSDLGDVLSSPFSGLRRTIVLLKPLPHT